MTTLNKINPLREAILASVICMGLVGVSTYMVYEKAKASLIQEIKIGLESNVASAASSIDGEAHKLFTKDTPRDDSVYLKHALPLEDIRTASTDIRYIYTNIIKDDKVYFVLNPSPQNDNDGDGAPDLAPALMDEYLSPAPELVTALRDQKNTVSEIYSDQWGAFISSYAPFYDSEGEFVGTLGMDLELQNFYTRLSPVDRAFEKTIVIILFIGLVTGLLIWYIRKNTSSLVQSNQALLKSEQDTLRVLQNESSESSWLLKEIRNTLSSQEPSIQAIDRNEVLSVLSHVIDYQDTKYPETQSDNHAIDIKCLIGEITPAIEKIAQSVTVEIRPWQNGIQLHGLEPKWYLALLYHLSEFLLNYTTDKKIRIELRLLDEKIEGSHFLLNLSTSGTINLGLLFRKFKENLKPNLQDLTLLTCLNILESAGSRIHPYAENGSIGFAIKLYFAKKPY